MLEDGTTSGYGGCFLRPGSKARIFERRGKEKKDIQIDFNLSGEMMTFINDKKGHNLNS